MSARSTPVRASCRRLMRRGLAMPVSSPYCQAGGEDSGRVFAAESRTVGSVLGESRNGNNGAAPPLVPVC
jgi:hypothetical protein